MATIEIYSPSSHSQIVDTGTTIVAEAKVSNYGRAWGYAQMIIGGAVRASGSIESLRNGAENQIVRATYYIGANHEGDTLTVSAYLYEVTAGGSVIKSLTSPHVNFRIYVRQPPPVQLPWFETWDEFNNGDDWGGNGNGSGKRQRQTGKRQTEVMAATVKMEIPQITSEAEAQEPRRLKP